MEQRIPSPISIPLLAISEHLGLPPVATYAGLVLWNYKSLNLHDPLYKLDNLATLNTFTGSLDEMWFYLVSVEIEASGGKLMHDMLEAFRAAEKKDTDGVLNALREFSPRLDEIAVLISRMQEECDPAVFYYHIRPLLSGSKNMAAAGLPNGVIYDTGKGDESYRQYSGGSNGQSSLIQFIDIVLGIRHGPTGHSPPATRPCLATSAPASTASADAPSDAPSHAPSHAPSDEENSFIHDSRMYMPAPHREFLERVAACPNIKQYVLSLPENKELITAFDNCIKAATHFRNAHMNIVHRYITTLARKKVSWVRGGAVSGQMNIALASTNLDGGDAPQTALRGTGGSDLAKFLRQTRDETTAAAIVPFVNRNSGLDRFLDGAWKMKALVLGEGKLEEVKEESELPRSPQSDTAVEGSDSEVTVKRVVEKAVGAVEEKERYHVVGAWPEEA